MSIKFITGYPPYRAGDVAGFTPDKEKQLVKAGVAKNLKSPPKDKMIKQPEAYKCECGREFSSPQGLGAHKRFCEKAGD